MHLAQHFLDLACAQIRGQKRSLGIDARRVLSSNRWPGNVRQLQNVIFRAVATAEGILINATDLELAGSELTQAPAPVDTDSLEYAVQSFERNLLARLYPEYPTTRLLAARLKTSHTAIGQRLRKYGIS